MSLEIFFCICGRCFIFTDYTCTQLLLRQVHLYKYASDYRQIKKQADGGVQNSPGGRPYLRSRPVGLEGVTQSMLTSFLRHWSMSTELKKATDWGRSCMPNAWANILLQETQAHNQESSQGYSLFYGGYFWQGRIHLLRCYQTSSAGLWSGVPALLCGGPCCRRGTAPRRGCWCRNGRRCRVPRRATSWPPGSGVGSPLQSSAPPSSLCSW